MPVKIRCLRRAVSIALVLLFLGAGSAALFPPDLARLDILGRIVRDRAGRPIAFYPDARGEWKFATTREAVDPLLIRMLIAVEDHRFYEDPGFDPLAIARAAVQLLAAGHVVSGASTLTMQVVRLSDPSPRRLGVKLREAFQALALTERYSKRRILGMWLSLAPFAGNIVGVEAASRLWFGKPPHDLDAAEAALLLALSERPEALRPDRHPEAARIARNRILAYAAAKGVITQEEAQRAEKEPVPLRRLLLPEASPQWTIRLQDGTRTTLEAPLNRALSSLAKNALSGMPASESLSILIVDARTRAVRAAFLGDFANPARAGFVNLARAVRSPGSALKPFLYGLAFEEGLAAPETPIEDFPHDFGAYGPDDFSHRFMGTVTAATALRRSLNLPAVTLLQRYGARRFAATLAAAGAPLALPRGAAPSLTLALGGAGITMTRLAALYAALATDGRVERLHWIAGERRPLRPLLRKSVAREIAALLTRPLPGETSGGIAWKTGTSAGNRDDWAIGFDRRHVVIVWTGRPDGGALPGGAAIDRSVPILARVFGLLPRAPLTPGPRAAPLAMRHLPAAAPPALAWPPPGANVADLGPIGLRAVGGVRPLHFLIDGAPLASLPALRRATFTPEGPGFYRIEIIDAAGHSSTSWFRVLPAERAK